MTQSITNSVPQLPDLNTFPTSRIEEIQKKVGNAFTQERVNTYQKEKKTLEEIKLKHKICLGATIAGMALMVAVIAGILATAILFPHTWIPLMVLGGLVACTGGTFFAAVNSIHFSNRISNFHFSTLPPEKDIPYQKEMQMQVAQKPIIEVLDQYKVSTLVDYNVIPIKEKDAVKQAKVYCVLESLKNYLDEINGRKAAEIGKITPHMDVPYEGGNWKDGYTKTIPCPQFIDKEKLNEINTRYAPAYAAIEEAWKQTKSNLGVV